MSLPRLQQWWAAGSSDGGTGRGARGRRALTEARKEFTDGDADADEIATRVADLTSALQALVRPGDRTDWQQLSDLVHRGPAAGTVGRSSRSRQLRGLARALLRHHGFTTRDEIGAAVSPSPWLSCSSS
ncbi:hypothetical protein GCM10009836_72280 [Pseudonocardia ailaonensis]|uniref:Uncharacterized protein n=1 Tax=Pseudonocardia ailaonensis TaxID=367279 RepID=A0ABN2NPF7_9PSEU